MEAPRCISRVHLVDCLADREIYDARVPRLRNLCIPGELRFYPVERCPTSAVGGGREGRRGVLVEFNPAVIFRIPIKLLTSENQLNVR